MSTNINIKQFDDMNVTGKDDRILYDTVHSNGVIHGCTVSYLGTNKLRVAAGYGIIKGALFEILEHDISVTLAQSGTLLGQLYIKLDLGQEDPISIIAESAASRHSMVQESDANFTNGVYEIQLCTFDVGTTVLSNLTNTFPTVSDLPTYVSNQILAKVAIGWTGTASASGVRYERIKIGSNWTEINGTKYMEQTKTLSTSAETVFTYSNNAITTSSAIDVYASVFDVNPSKVEVSASQCKVTFKKASSAQSLTVRIYIR